MDRRAPALFALGVALLLVTTPVYPLPHAGKPEYTHYIERVPASEVPTKADVFQYTVLSPEAKAAIQDARTDDGVVYGKTNKPPEFLYSDAIALNHGRYYIHQDDTYYRLTTLDGVEVISIEHVLQWGLVLLGLGIGLIGFRSLADRRVWLPTGVGVYGGLVLLGALLQPSHGAVLGEDRGTLLLVPLALVGFATTLVAFGLIARR